MFRTHTIALGLTACFILSGCNDKIEEANTAADKPSVEAAAVTQPMVAQSGHTHAAGATSVADLFAKKQELNGKSVTVDGNVVKVSEGIMGKNWIHIQDGSGAEGTNDIVFTSATQSAVVGDHVVATGTVATDKDFGYGYFYSVIVEDATFTK